MVVQPDHIPAWDEFTVRRAAQENDEVRSTETARTRPAARTPSLAGVLLEAIQVASTRRGRLSQAERIREQTLLEVLTAAMRRAR